jgi:hypothetical protein
LTGINELLAKDSRAHNEPRINSSPVLRRHGVEG